MTILPGSLDYLYYNGILEHIPYEAYEMVMASPSGTKQNSMESELREIRNMKKQGLNGTASTYNSNIQGYNMQNNSYQNTIQKGQMYGYNGNSYDSFNGTTNYQQMGMQPQEKMSGRNNRRGLNIFRRNGESGVNNKYDSRLQNDEYDFKSLINSESKDSKTGVLNSHHLWKGLIATAIIIATPILLIKGLIKPKAAKNTAAKPKSRRWFKKKNPPPPPNTTTQSSNKKSFWSKLDPRNWFK